MALNISEEYKDAIIHEMSNLSYVVCRPKDVDNESIHCIIINVIAEMERLDIRSDKINCYQLCAFAPILFWFIAHNRKSYDTALLSELDLTIKSAYNSGKFSYSWFCIFRNGINIVRTYCEHGELQMSDIPHRTEYSLGTVFQNLLDLYRDMNGEYFTISANTLASRLSAIRMFLYFLEQRRISTTEQFTHKIINENITAFAGAYTGGLTSILSSIRIFLSFLHKAGVSAIDYSEAVPRGVPKHHKIKYGFTNKEVTAILNAVNRDTVIGKRDYAMMLIAARTGLRACDIAMLKFSDIDWRTKEVRIVQQKTGVPLTLPLLPEVGNAIADYILNARPKTNTAYIFLNCIKPYNQVKPENVGLVVTKYSTCVGATNPITPTRSVHAFRRNFAMNMLEASITNDMMLEMLGQVEPNSSKAYLAIDENGLKDCSISLASVKQEVTSDI